VKVKSYEELNAWLADRCVAWAKAHRHPEVQDKTIWEMFETERPSLVPYAGPFDGFNAVQVSVSKTCLVRFDNNKYSVSASAVGRPAEIRAYAERIEIRQGEPCRANGPSDIGERAWLASTAASSAGARRSMPPGTMSLFSLANPGR
jgi:hypothetical protein